MATITITISDRDDGIAIVAKPSFLDMGKKIKSGADLSPAEAMGVLILKSVHEQSKVIKVIETKKKGLWKPGDPN